MKTLLWIAGGYAALYVLYSIQCTGFGVSSATGCSTGRLLFPWEAALETAAQPAHSLAALATPTVAAPPISSLPSGAQSWAWNGFTWQAVYGGNI
jgi:hypothetical protein